MLQKLLDKIANSSSNINKDFITKAYCFASDAHKEQKENPENLI